MPEVDLEEGRRDLADAYRALAKDLERQAERQGGLAGQARRMADWLADGLPAAADPVEVVGGRAFRFDVGDRVLLEMDIPVGAGAATYLASVMKTLAGRFPGVEFVIVQGRVAGVMRPEPAMPSLEETDDEIPKIPKIRSWTEIRKHPDAESEARIAQFKLEALAEIGLYELRRRRALSQADLAEALGITQPAVSQLEHQPDPQLSTLRSYIEGLGGELHMTAVFPDEHVTYDLAIEEPT